jgi:hypothetical protein
MIESSWFMGQSDSLVVFRYCTLDDLGIVDDDRCAVKSDVIRKSILNLSTVLLVEEEEEEEEKSIGAS